MIPMVKKVYKKNCKLFNLQKIFYMKKLNK
jgi:hypothetical protein